MASLGNAKTPASPAESEVFDSVTQEDAALEKLGYQPELKRSFGLLGMLGFSFNIVTSWSALSGVLIVGVQSGGPPVMIWSWIGICLVSLAVVACLAEQCSAYPVAGGQYSWVAIVAPKKIARGMSYICGWVIIVGVTAMGATNNFIAANFIVGMAQLTSADTYVIQRWQTTLVSWSVALLAVGVNLFLPHILNTFSRGMLIWNITAFVVIVITILATNDHKHSAEFVFSTLQNSTGFSNSYAAIVGLLQASFGMCCYDAPAHMTEEMHDARRAAPRAMIWSVILGGVTGFIFLIAVCFCIGDVTAVATSATGVPLIQIIADSTQSHAATCVLITLITVINLVSAIGLTAEGSRVIFAFARDRGLPASSLLSQVRSRYRIPVAALLLTLLIQLGLNAIYFGSYTGFLTVTSIATAGFYLSYAMPLLARLLSPAHEFDGPYALRRWSVPLSLASLLFLAFAFVTFNLPTLRPVTPQNFNWCSAAVGGVVAIAAANWLVKGRRDFSGPRLLGGGGVDVVSEAAPEHGYGAGK